MAKDMIRMSPDVCAYVNNKHTVLNMEISIPGVKKENINLRMHHDSLYLKAPRENIEYVTALSFCCPVVSEKAKAKFEHGILKIEVPFKDVMSDSVKVKVK